MAWARLSLRPRRQTRLRIAALLLATLALGLIPSLSLHRHVSQAEDGVTALAGTLAYLRAGNVWVIAGGVARQLTLTGDAQTVRWTPAGGYLVIGTAHGAIVLRGDGSQAPVQDGAWTRDDRVVAVQSADGGVALQSPSDGSSSALVPAQPGVRFAPVAWSPDGSQLLLNRDTLGDKGLPTAEEVWIAGRDGTLRRLIGASANWPRALGWSPDGSWIAFWQGPAEACVSCRADGQDVQLISADGARTLDVGTVLRREWLAWSPDGMKLAAVIGAGRETYRDKQIVVISPDSGQTTRLAGAAGVQIQPAWSADGATLAYTAGPAVPGDLFTNLDAAHGYPAAVLGNRAVRLDDPATGKDAALDAPSGWAEEAPQWAGPNALLMVRWRFSGQNGAVQAQVWQVSATDGSAVLLVDGLGGAAPPVNYYGEFGWSQDVAWHP